MSDSKVVIVSRHAGVVAWLTERGITGEVIPHVSKPEQIEGTVLYGNVPFNLAVLAARLLIVELPNLTAEQRGKDLSPTEMDEAGARLVEYRVQIVE